MVVPYLLDIMMDIINFIGLIIFQGSREKHSLRRKANVGFSNLGTSRNLTISVWPLATSTGLSFLHAKVFGFIWLMVSQFVVIYGVRASMVKVDRGSLALIPTEPKFTNMQVLVVSHIPNPPHFVYGHDNLSTIKEEGFEERTRLKHARPK